MNTTTTTNEAVQILINEYIEVKTGLFEMLDNLYDMGRTSSILSDVLSERYHELFRMISAYYPNATMDEVLDMIAGFETD